MCKCGRAGDSRKIVAFSGIPIVFTPCTALLTHGRNFFFEDHVKIVATMVCTSLLWLVFLVFSVVVWSP